MMANSSLLCMSHKFYLQILQMTAVRVSERCNCDKSDSFMFIVNQTGSINHITIADIWFKSSMDTKLVEDCVWKNIFHGKYNLMICLYLQFVL